MEDYGNVVKYKTIIRDNVGAHNHNIQHFYQFWNTNLLVISLFCNKIITYYQAIRQSMTVIYRTHDYWCDNGIVKWDWANARDLVNALLQFWSSATSIG